MDVVEARMELMHDKIRASESTQSKNSYELMKKIVFKVLTKIN